MVNSEKSALSKLEEKYHLQLLRNIPHAGELGIPILFSPFCYFYESQQGTQAPLWILSRGGKGVNIFKKSQISFVVQSIYKLIEW